jgi:hypothetical protein
MPDQRTRVMRRRLPRGAQSVEAGTRVQNDIHAILIRPEVSDLFGKTARAWLAELDLPIEERETHDSGLRQIAFFDGEIGLVDRVIAHDALPGLPARRRWAHERSDRIAARLVISPGTATTHIASIQ